MKELPVLQFTESESTLSFLKIALNAPPINGLDLATIRARSRVMDTVEKLEKDAGNLVLKLEDTDYTAAKEAIRQVRWNVLSKHLIRFAEQFEL